MIFLDNGIYEEDYEHTNQNILIGNVMNMSLIIMEGEYGAIDTDYSSCPGYYIITFSSSPYNLQVDLSIYGQVISSGGIVCEVTYFFPINLNYNYYVLQKTKSINIIVSLRKTINGNVNVICYDSKDVISPCLWYISNNDYNNLSPLHIPMKEHDYIMDINN